MSETTTSNSYWFPARNATIDAERRAEAIRLAEHRDRIQRRDAARRDEFQADAERFNHRRTRAQRRRNGW